MDIKTKDLIALGFEECFGEGFIYYEYVICGEFDIVVTADVDNYQWEVSYCGEKGYVTKDLRKVKPLIKAAKEFKKAINKIKVPEVSMDSCTIISESKHNHCI